MPFIRHRSRRVKQGTAQYTRYKARHLGSVSDLDRAGAIVAPALGGNLPPD
jgi:hypothetical protein